MNLTTKARIHQAAIRLFNANGLCNVRLQQIADETGISVGNLAYHYKNKEALIASVYEGLYEQLAGILAEYLHLPAFEDLDHQLARFYGFFEAYPFFLLDLFEVERILPPDQIYTQQYGQKIHLQLKQRLLHLKESGYLKPEPFSGIYEVLASNMWTSLIFWIPQRTVRRQNISERSFKDAFWCQVLPYLTEEGIKEFRRVIRPTNFIIS